MWWRDAAGSRSRSRRPSSAASVDMSALVELIRNFESRAQLPCIFDEGRVYNYSDLLERTAHWRSELAGFAPGRVIGLRADYSLDAIALLLASLATRAIVAMIPRGSAIEPYLRDCFATELVSIDAAGRVERTPCEPAPADHPLISRLRASGDGGLVIFTSGSTARPKAALQSAERFLLKFAAPGRRMRTIAFLLFDHIAGLDTLFYTLTNGGTLVLTRRRDPGSILDLVEAARVQVLPASPSFLRLLCLAHWDRTRDLSSLEVVTYGSEPMDGRTLTLLNERFPNVRLSQKYGTTETGAPRSVSRGNDSLWIKLKSSRRGDVETKVVDGVLWIRSESSMLGYLNAESPLGDDQWYCTGDLVEVDGDWLRFLGRASERINVGGEKVSPAEVESTILELDFVRGAAVEGEPHALMGQIVIARVALAYAVDAREAARLIRAHCCTRLARYKVPIKIDLVADIATNDRQKKKRLTDLVRAVPGSLPTGAR